jgi:hypothetical protein
VVVFAVAALACTALSASADTGTGGVPIVVAGSSGGQIHHCSVVGTPADGYQAVICADISTSQTDSARDYEATGAIEVLCETTSGVTVQCANIDIEGVFANGTGQDTDAGWWGCGHSLGACPSGRRIITEGRINYSGSAYPSCLDNPNSNFDLWTVVYGGTTQIELPVSGKYVTLGAGSGANDGSNFSTGHYYVCPYDPA